jgi:hypothetical protein
MHGKMRLRDATERANVIWQLGNKSVEFLLIHLQGFSGDPFQGQVEKSVWLTERGFC